MISINTALLEARKKLNKHNIDEREARLLLAFVLNVKHEELIKFQDISEKDLSVYDKIIDRRCNGVPYAYIVGHKEFMKLDFFVNENVLIPREDTEVVVSKAIELLNTTSSQKAVLDMCTGSGCIAISLAKYVNNVRVYAVDISEKALEVARKNAEKNQVFISFVQSDLFLNIDKGCKFDLIISNPPYIQKDVIKTLSKEVKENEPLLALDGGEDGLDFYKRISKDAKDYLSTGGTLIFEIGYDEAKQVTTILENEGYREIQSFKDLSGNDRVIIATK